MQWGNCVTEQPGLAVRVPTAHTAPCHPCVPPSPGFQHGATQQPPAALAPLDLHPQMDLPLHLLIGVHLAEAHPAAVACGKRGNPHGGGH